MPVTIKKADGSAYAPPKVEPALHTVAVTVKVDVQVVAPPAPEPKPPVVSPLVDAVKKSKAPLPQDSLPPWESPPECSFAQALSDLVANKYPGRVLKIISKNNGSSYTIMSYNPVDKRAVIVTPEGLTLNPVLGPREEPLYHAHWE